MIQATQQLTKHIKNRTSKRNRSIEVYARHGGKGEMIGEGLLDQIGRVKQIVPESGSDKASLLSGQQCLKVTAVW